MKLSDQITRRQLFVAFGTSQQSGGLTSVDLAATRDENLVILTASDGSAAPVDGADATTAGVMTAADKTALDELSAATFRAFGTRSEIPSTLIGAGIAHLSTAGYTTEGDGGGARYTRVGSEPTHALKVQSADGAWWQLVPNPMGIDLRQAGAVNDDATDAGPAINAILGFTGLVESGENRALPRILVNGAYYVGATIELKATVHVLGLGSGLSGIKGSQLRFPANTTGIIVHRGVTEGAGTVTTATGAADSSIIEGVRLVSDGGTIANITDDTKGHGIWLRARAFLRGIDIDGFPGNGVFIRANQGSGGSTEGNANLWRIEGARARNCHLSGFYVNGADVNAGRAHGIDASNNGRAGIFDSSFLGNLWEGCHTSGNGTAEKGENGGTNSYWVHHNDGSDKRYIANVDATEAALVATTPGTNEGVWIYVQDGGASSGIPTWQSGQPEGTYFHGGPYLSDNNNAKNVFLSCYIENGYPQFVAPTLYLGGENMHRAKGTGGGVTVGTNGMSLRGKGIRIGNKDEYSPDRDIELKLNRAVNEIMSLETDGGGRHSHTWNESAGIWELYKHNGLNSRRPIYITTPHTTEKFGRSSAPEAGRIIFGQGFWLGGFSTGRHMTNGTAAPASGDHARGDIIWNRDASTGSPLGWICVTAGNPGTWAEIRGVGTQTSGADQAALSNGTGGVRDGTLAAVSDTTAADQSGVINDNLTELHTLLDEVRATLVSFGLMKGAA